MARVIITVYGLCRMKDKNERFNDKDKIVVAVVEALATQVL